MTHRGLGLGLFLLGVLAPALPAQEDEPKEGDLDEIFREFEQPKNDNGAHSDDTKPERRPVADVLNNYREARKQFRQARENLKRVAEEVQGMPAEEEREFFRGAFDAAIEDAVQRRTEQGATEEELLELRWDLEELRDDLADRKPQERVLGVFEFIFRKIGERVVEELQTVIEKLLEQAMKLELPDMEELQQKLPKIPGLPGSNTEIIPKDQDEWNMDWLDEGLPGKDAPAAAPQDEKKEEKKDAEKKGSDE